MSIWKGRIVRFELAIIGRLDMILTSYIMRWKYYLTYPAKKIIFLAGKVYVFLAGDFNTDLLKVFPIRSF